jgi:glycosyltransferase involved in cell wall biosynthesis
MKILYDHQAFTGSYFGGVSRYLVEIITELSKNKKIKPIIKVIFSNNWHLTQFKTNRPIPIPSFERAMLLASLINRIGSILALKKNNFDVFHPTYYHRYFLKYVQKPFVITFHDTAAEDFPQYEILGNDKPLRQEILTKAKRIIAISEATKQDILRHYEVDAHKIDVIHHATQFDELTAQKVENLPHRFVLFVGQRGYYKNFNSFLAHLSPILKQENLHLVCVGGGDFTETEHQLMKQWDVQDLVCKVAANSDEALLFVYQQAAVFVYPSRLEGFGIPILEAMAANCPILLSDIPVFREIAQDAALYFKLDDAASLQENLLEILKNPTNLVENGKKRLTFFSWEKAAQLTLQTYKRAMNL